MAGNSVLKVRVENMVEALKRIARTPEPTRKTVLRIAQKALLSAPTDEMYDAETAPLRARINTLQSRVFALRGALLDIAGASPSDPCLHIMARNYLTEDTHIANSSNAAKLSRELKEDLSTLYDNPIEFPLITNDRTSIPPLTDELFEKLMNTKTEPYYEGGKGRPEVTRAEPAPKKPTPVSALLSTLEKHQTTTLENLIELNRQVEFYSMPLTAETNGEGEPDGNPSISPLEEALAKAIRRQIAINNRITEIIGHLVT